MSEQGTLRQEQKERSRVAILSSAVTLFQKAGITQTSTADIARHAGYSHGTVFMHFPTRDALVSSALRQMGRKITDSLHRLVEGAGSLEQVLAAHIDALEENGALYRRLLRERESLPAEFKLIWLGIQSAISGYINRIAETGMSSGKIKKMPAAFLFNTWIGLLHHYLLNEEMFAPQGNVLKKKKKELIAGFLNLVEK